MKTISYPNVSDQLNFITITSRTTQLHDLLLTLGMPPNIIGYSHILYSMELILEQPEYLNSVTKGLYIDVAKKFHTTPAAVERAIRHAINITWLHGNPDFIAHMFKNCVRADKVIPSNSLFLARLYFYITNMEHSRS